RLGNSLLRQGLTDEAIVHYLATLEKEPRNATAHHWLGTALTMKKKPGEARTHLKAAVELQPDNAAALNDLAWLLTSRAETGVRDVPEAIRLAGRACQLTTNREALYLDTLSLAYSEAGRMDESIQTA